mmetsp:Transcript_15535/g.32445  ORF Transcript_15535/g.32445 Transcript_15535/m.32445 type:complete len:236 (+) Transcript_15535:439-1146(+)
MASPQGGHPPPVLGAPRIRPIARHGGERSRGGHLGGTRGGIFQEPGHSGEGRRRIVLGGFFGRRRRRRRGRDDRDRRCRRFLFLRGRRHLPVGQQGHPLGRPSRRHRRRLRAPSSRTPSRFGIGRRMRQDLRGVGYHELESLEVGRGHRGGGGGRGRRRQGRGSRRRHCRRLPPPRRPFRERRAKRKYGSDFPVVERLPLRTGRVGDWIFVGEGGDPSVRRRPSLVGGSGAIAGA